MKNENLYREIFINNAISLVATGGFESATTRAIAGDRKEVNDVKLNEAHIYRVFGTKERLFAEAFSVLDEELLCVITENLSIMKKDGDFRQQYEETFSNIWRLMLHDEERCRYYTRYYHSVYFRNEIYAEHKRRYTPLMEKISPRFVPSADVWAIFQHVFTSLLEFALRVYNGTLPDNEDTATHIVNVTYSAMAPYLI